MLTFMCFSRRFIILAIAISTALSAELSEKQRMKLHPFFQSLVAKPSLHERMKTLYWLRDEPASAMTKVALYDAIISTHDASALRSMGVRINSIFPEFVTAQLSASDILNISSLENVQFIDPGSKNYPQLDVSTPEIGASLLHAGFINTTSYKGNGAIVVIYDTGIDWKHFDFRKSDTTKSRILCIWDQTIDSLAGDQRPDGFTYGVEYTQAQIENELDGSPVGFVREADIHGHGTHVASTAAGNGSSYNRKYIGVAPEADIIVIKGGDGSFYETRMIDGLTYAQNKALAYGKPVVLNWSIGGQYGSHDGTRAYEAAVDYFVANPGRVVCISAGNNGSSLMHMSGTVTATTMDTLKVTVPSTRTSGSVNDYFDLDCWLLDNTSTGVNVKSPTGTIYNFPNNSYKDSSTADGGIYVWNYTSSQNNHREIFVEIYDAAEDTITNGTWSITMTKPSGTSTFDAWLAGSGFGGYPATLINGDANKTIGMPGTSKGAITVGSYTTRPVWYSYNNSGYTWGTQDNISSFSSIGPTADGRMKPDIAAPGQVIVAALSSFVDTNDLASDIVMGNKHQIMAGTSMACPHVTGGAALLLGAYPSLTAAQIKTLLTSTANSDAYATGLPNYFWGYGKLDVLEAMAQSVSNSATVTRTTIAYDGTGSNAIVPITGSTKVAVRFSPTVSGTLTGIQVNITTPSNRPIEGNGNLVCEVYTDNSGTPGTKIGSTVNQSLSLLSAGTNNYIQMLDANINITSGTEYHIVLSSSNPTDTIIVRAEAVSGTRSSTFNGSSWSAQTYNFRIRSIIATTSGLTGIGENLNPEKPLVFQLSQNYPNPFNPTTKISYSIPKTSEVTLTIFNLLGQAIATLVHEQQEANTYVKEFDASRFASGTYFYQINAGSFHSTKKMILVK
jgi:minor extracellular serine protease Vpr